MRALDFVIDTTKHYIAGMPKEMRKNYGQFFTGKETARFMAGLFTAPHDKKCISVLDPGAGSGILSAAVVERLETLDSVDRIEVTCYENDAKIVPLLESNLGWISEHSTKDVVAKVITENYITSQADEYNDFLCHSDARKYDIIIGNPPYMKTAKDAPEALSMPDICYGAPNTYFLFMGMSAFNLRPHGEMVYIVPRSWTSGAYFQRFREKFLAECSLQHIHLFISRDKVFDDDSVLQETMVIKACKGLTAPESITVTTTHSSSDFSELTKFVAPYGIVVSDRSRYVYLVTGAEDAAILDRLNSLHYTLPELGLKMKTGLTVDFRNYDVLRDAPEAGSVPLFYSGHIQKGGIKFPIGRKREYINTERKSLLQKNANYLFVKRFTSKEEPRRLQSGVYLAKDFPQYRMISTQNKINFICGESDMSECLVYGLFVIFNSTIYDRYYRILNGSTQVNSTEINSIPTPSLSTIEKMGRTVMSCKDFSEESCNSILGRILNED